VGGRYAYRDKVVIGGAAPGTRCLRTKILKTRQQTLPEAGTQAFQEASRPVVFDMSNIMDIMDGRDRV